MMNPVDIMFLSFWVLGFVCALYPPKWVVGVVDWISGRYE